MRTVCTLDIFAVIYLLGFVFLHIPAEGQRLLLPAAIPLFIFIVRSARVWLREHGPLAVKRYAAEVFKGILLFFIFSNIVSIMLVFNFNDDAIVQPDIVELVDWLKEENQDPQF